MVRKCFISGVVLVQGVLRMPINYLGWSWELPPFQKAFVCIEVFSAAHTFLGSFHHIAMPARVPLKRQVVGFPHPGQLKQSQTQLEFTPRFAKLTTVSYSLLLTNQPRTECSSKMGNIEAGSDRFFIPSIQNPFLSRSSRATA